MNGTEKQHLSPEMIEDAAFGRLSPEQRVEVDSHLAGCTRCREALEQERLIAAGTRSWARATMKKKLAANIEAASPRQIPWPHVLGAAALFVVIIGVGVLFHWREPASEQTLTFSDSATIAQPTTIAPSASPPVTARDEALPEQQEIAAGSGLEVDRSREKMTSETDQLLSAPPSPEMAKKDEEMPAAVVAAPAAEEVTVDRAAPSEAWVGGEQVANAFRTYKQSQPAGASNQGVALNRLEARKGSYAKSAPSPVFIIAQRPLRASPDVQMDIPANTTPTRLVRSGDTLYVTLYLDTLLTPEQMRSAFGLQISPDSFQVFLPGRVLGYRMPQTYAR